MLTLPAGPSLTARLRRAALAGLSIGLLATLVAGCGSDGSQAAARTALERVAAGDGAGLCEFLSERALEQVHNSDGSVEACRAEVESHAIGEGPEDAAVEIEGSTRQGERIAVDAQIGTAAELTGVRVLLVQEGGSWKVEEFEYDIVAAGAASGETKSLVRTAQSALESYATDNRGSYAGAETKELARIEPLLGGERYQLRTTADTYRLGARSEAGTAFAIARRGSGRVELLCSPPGAPDCPESGEWG